MLTFIDYGPSLYAGLGYNTKDTLLIQSGWITTIVFGNVINAFALDKFGRRPLLGKQKMAGSMSLTDLSDLVQFSVLWGVFYP